MDGFRNLNAAARLLLSFGVLMVFIAAIVGEIAAAASEQSTGVDQLNTSVAQMDRVIQSNSAQTEELSATAQSFADQSARLAQLVGKFKLRNRHEQARLELGHKAQAQGSWRFSGTQTWPAGVARPRATLGQPIYSPTNRQRHHAEPAVLVGGSASSREDASFEEF